MSNDPERFLKNVRHYWRTTHADYLAHVGTTFQAGFLNSGTASHSNVEHARRAGIAAGDLVLDAGCGVCGPAVDIAQAIAGVRIVGVTISMEQAAEARGLIAAKALQQSVRTIVSDYHQLPFRAGVFDVVCLLESAVYTWDPDILLSEAFRVLRPGGRLYIKDVFCRAGTLSEHARADLDEFQAVFSCRIRTISDLESSAARVKFREIRGRDITPEISTLHARRAMYRGGDPRSGLTAFGEKHFRFYWDLPLYFAELKAIKPSAQPCANQP